MQISAELSDRGVVEIAGPEAVPFLQGLVTNDVTKASTTQAVFSALLTPQGKILHDFILSREGEILRLDCAQSGADDLALRLTRYKLRAKLSITNASDRLAVFHTANQGEGTYPDPRHAALGHRRIGPRSDNIAYPFEFHRQRLNVGVPETGSDISQEKFFPLDCNFEELNGVDFDKGCYVGQELTARMKHRSTARKRILKVKAKTTLPPVGTAITLAGTELGEMLGSVEAQGLAIIRLDRLGAARHAQAANTGLSIEIPHYLSNILSETGQ